LSTQWLFSENIVSLKTFCQTVCRHLTTFKPDDLHAKKAISNTDISDYSTTCLHSVVSRISSENISILL